MNAQPDSMLIRECRNLEELGACVRLQTAIWGFEREDLIPRRAFVVARSIGGQTVGAFDLAQPGQPPEGDARSLAGFAMALPAIGQTGPYLHSHMLGVDARYRNRGIGRRLKLWQREDALRRGIRRMEWTFDPLEIKNSFFNMRKLAVVARRYAVNLYGVSSSSLHGSLPTDRLYAEWWMDSPRVASAMNGEPCIAAAVEKTIKIPRWIGEWRRAAPERDEAVAAQEMIRHSFQEAFREGLTATGFTIDGEGEGIFELGRWEGAAAPVP